MKLPRTPYLRELMISIMCVIAAFGIIFCVIMYKIVWIFRMASLAHWSYLVGSTLYPKDSKSSFTISATLFGFIVMGSFIPKYFPRLRGLAMALSVFPQIHMLAILNNFNEKINRKVEMQTLSKAIHVYTAVTLATAGWTLLNVFFPFGTM